jgi:catechol 2,3-dioxygenase-like lactoylglutathione lyase family enzyme
MARKRALATGELCVEVVMACEFRSTRDVIVRSTAWDRALDFYGSVLALPVTYRSEDLVGFETGSFLLYLERSQSPGSGHGPVFEFLVPDLAAARQQLLAAGCVIEEENSSIPRCYIRDPFGMVFNIGPTRSD